MAKPVTIKILGDASGLSKALGTAEAGLGKLGGAVAGASKLAGAAIVGVGAVAAGGFVKGFSDAMDREALGAVVGEDVLGAAADIYRNAWGGSLEEVSMMVADAQRTFGEDADLTYITEGAYAISQKLGLDTQEILNTAGVAIADFGGDGTQVMDLFAAKLGGMSQMAAEEALAATQEYGTVFDGLGFSLSTTLGVMGSFGEKGTIGVDKVSDAFKELTIRGSDMSEGTGKAYAALGLDQEKLTRMLLAGGEDAFSAMQLISSGLEGMEDPIAQSQHALALFGAPLEDLGATQIPEFFETLSAGMGTWEDTTGAAGALGAELGDNLKTKLEGLKRQGFDKLAEVIQERVIPAVTRLVDYGVANFPKWRDAIMPVIDAVIEGVQMFATVLRGGESDGSFMAKLAVYLRDELWPLVMDIKDWFVENWPKISEVIGNVIGFIVEEILPRVIEAVRFVAEVVGDVIGYIVDHWPQISEVVQQVIDFVVDQVLPRVIKAVRFVAEVVGDVIGYIVDHWPQISEVVQQVIDFVVDQVLPRIVTAFEWIKERVQEFIEVFQSFWDAWGERITETVTNIFGEIQEFIAGTWETIMGVFNTFKGLFTGDWGLMWDGIVDVVSGIGRRLRAAFMIAWEVFKFTFSALWEGLKTLVSAIFRDIVDYMKALPGDLKDAALGAVGAIAEAGTELGKALFDAIKEQVKGIPGMVGGFLKDVGGGVVDFFNPFSGGDDGPRTNKLGQREVPVGTPNSYIDPESGLNVSLYQHGGGMRPGLALVGERGPELLNIPNSFGGGSVTANEELGGLMGGVTVNVSTNADPVEIGAAVAWELRKAG